MSSLRKRGKKERPVSTAPRRGTGRQAAAPSGRTGAGAGRVKKTAAATAASGRPRRRVVQRDDDDEEDDEGGEGEGDGDGDGDRGEDGERDDDAEQAPAAFDVRARAEAFVLSDRVPLLDAYDTVYCTYGEDRANRQDAWLSGVFQIYADRDKKSRLGYRASFFMTTDLAGDTPHDFVGYIDSWRIDRATVAKPDARSPWVDELLTPGIDEFGENVRETAVCLQALYTKKGNLRGAARVEALRDQLRDDGLTHVQLVHAADEHQNRGLLRPILTLYRQLMAGMPEWLAFNDTLVRVPGAPTGDAGAVWGDQDAGDVEDTLRDIYQCVGGHVVCARNAKVGDNRITVMGRVVS